MELIVFYNVLAPRLEKKKRKKKINITKYKVMKVLRIVWNILLIAQQKKLWSSPWERNPKLSTRLMIFSGPVSLKNTLKQRIKLSPPPNPQFQTFTVKAKVCSEAVDPGGEWLRILPHPCKSIIINICSSFLYWTISPMCGPLILVNSTLANSAHRSKER